MRATALFTLVGLAALLAMVGLSFWMLERTRNSTEEVLATREMRSALADLFSVIQDAMAEFQQLYIDKTIEVPLYYRDEVWLVNPKVQNFTGNPSSVGPTWNVADWYVTG